MLPFPYAAYGGSFPWGIYPAALLQQQQQQQQQQQNGATTPTANGRRATTPNTSATTPGPPDMPNGAQFPHVFPAGAAVAPVSAAGAFYDPSGLVRLPGAAGAAQANMAAAANIRMMTPTGAANNANAGNPTIVNNPNTQFNLTQQQQNSLGYGGNGSIGSPAISLSGFSGSRRDSMDRASSTAFSPSLEKTKSAQCGWPNYNALGGALTPPPNSNLAAAVAANNAAAINLFNNRLSMGADSRAAATAGFATPAHLAAVARNGMALFGSNNNLFGAKTRQNSIDSKAINRSKLLEDFRLKKKK